MIIVHRFVVIVNFYRFSRLKRLLTVNLKKAIFFIIFTKPYFEIEIRAVCG